MKAEARHEMATNALTMLFYSFFLPSPEILSKASESEKTEFDKTAIAKCKLAVAPYLTSAEKVSPPLKMPTFDGSINIVDNNHFRKNAMCFIVF